MIVRSRDGILASFLGNLAARMGVSNLRVGGKLVKLAEAFADEAFAVQSAIWESRDAGLMSSAQGPDLDAQGADILPDGLERSPATYATGGAGTFTRPNATAGAYTVPAGTPVSRSLDNVRYVSAADSAYGALDLASAPVSVVCQATGTIGNCDAAAIDTLGSTVGGGTTGFTNTSSIGNGTDEADDETYRDEMRLYTRGISRCTQAALIGAALKVQTATLGKVRHAVVNYSPTSPGKAQLIIDDGAATAGASTSVVAEVLLEVAAGGERKLYTAHRPVVAAVVKRDGVAEAGVTFVAPWGQIILPTVAVAGEKFTIDYTYNNRLCEQTQNAIIGDLSKILTTPDTMGAGCEITVAPATKHKSKFLPIQIALQLAANVALSDVSPTLKRAVVTTVNGLGIGEPLYRSDLIVVLKSYPEVVNVTLVEIDGVDGDETPLDTSVCRTRDADVVLL